MKRMAIALATMSLIAASSSSVAQDGAAIYKTKCSSCHGATGEGKPAVKAPTLKGTTWEASQIAQFIVKGESARKVPHNKGVSGVSDEQAKAVAEFVKSLK